MIHSVEEADGVLFLTMEYVEGKPPSDLIRKAAYRWRRSSPSPFH